MSAAQQSPAPEGLSKARLRLWLRLLKASGEVEAELRRRLRSEFDTTLPRFDVMAALARAPEGLRMSEISERLRVSNGNITGIVDRLVQEGLALRVAVPGDRRAMVARLTPRGQDVFAEQARAHEGWIDALLGGFDAAALAALSGHLEQMSAHIEKERE